MGRLSELFVLSEGWKGGKGNTWGRWLLTALRMLSHPLTLFCHCLGLICLVFGLTLLLLLLLSRFSRVQLCATP